MIIRSAGEGDDTDDEDDKDGGDEEEELPSIIMVLSKSALKEFSCSAWPTVLVVVDAAG